MKVIMLAQWTACLCKSPCKCYWLITLFICTNLWLLCRLSIFRREKGVSNYQPQLPKSNLFVLPPVTTTTTTHSHNLPNANEVLLASAQINSKKSLSHPQLQDGTSHLFNLERANLDPSLGRFDTSRKFKLFDNVIVGENYLNLSIEYDVTLATQSSLDKLHWISRLVR